MALPQPRRNSPIVRVSPHALYQRAELEPLHGERSRRRGPARGRTRPAPALLHARSWHDRIRSQLLLQRRRWDGVRNATLASAGIRSPEQG